MQRKIIKQSFGFALSQDLLASDQKRDASIIGIRSVAEGFSFHYDTQINQAATKLLNSIDKYGPAIARLNYQTETAPLNKLIYNWTNDPKLAEALSFLNLSTWAAQLKPKTNNLTIILFRALAKKPLHQPMWLRATAIP